MIEPMCKPRFNCYNSIDMNALEFVLKFSFIFFFQVESEASTYGWMEPILMEVIQWLKELRTACSNDEANVKCCYTKAGYVSTKIN